MLADLQSIYTSACMESLVEQIPGRVREKTMEDHQSFEYNLPEISGFLKPPNSEVTVASLLCNLPASFRTKTLTLEGKSHKSTLPPEAIPGNCYIGTPVSESTAQRFRQFTKPGSNGNLNMFFFWRTMLETCCFENSLS